MFVWLLYLVNVHKRILLNRGKNICIRCLNHLIIVVAAVTVILFYFLQPLKVFRSGLFWINWGGVTWKMQLQLLFSQVPVDKGLVLREVLRVLKVRHLTRKLRFSLLVVRILNYDIAVRINLWKGKPSFFSLKLCDGWKSFIDRWLSFRNRLILLRRIWSTLECKLIIAWIPRIAHCLQFLKSLYWLTSIYRFLLILIT